MNGEILEQVEAQPANGTQPLTPEAKLAAFQQELEALTNKYSVRLVAYIIRFNDGTQIADAKYIPVEK